MKWLFVSLAATSFGLLAQDAELCPEGPVIIPSRLRELVQEPRLTSYGQIEKDYKIVHLNSLPTSSSSTNVTYSNLNVKLRPGECAYFNVPEHLRNKPVLFVNLGHMQSFEDNTGWNAETKWDEKPGLTTVQLNETNESGEARWRYWNGNSSGKFGAKFAEPFMMELEGLYEWYIKGHSDIATNSRSTNPLFVDAMRLCSIGDDPVMIGNLALKVHPGVARSYQEINYSKSNVMGDSLTAEGRVYGRKDDGALRLGSETVEIPLEFGKKLKSFEVSVSDQRPDGSSGFAALNVFIQRRDGSTVGILNYENVPPEGVLVGAPESDFNIGPGDKLVIRSDRDISYLMGVKLGFD